MKAPAAGRLDVWDASVPGFGLRITSTGNRTWVVRYRRGRKQRVYSLGTAPTVSLADARERARQALADVRRGLDPAGARARERGMLTFAQLSAEYVARHAVKKRTGEQDRRMLEREVLPAWRPLAAKDVQRRDVMQLVDAIAEGRGARRRPGRPAPVRANRILALVRKVFNFGIQRGLVDDNPCRLVARPGGQERRRERVLSEAEIRGLWLGLDAEHAVLAGAVRMLLLTAQRRGEILRMRWQDLAEEASPAEIRNLWWTIPGEFTKAGRTHRVPLPPQAAAIVDELRAGQQPGPWVFGGRVTEPKTGERRHLVNIEGSIDRARERQGLAHFTPHDLRRTAASVMTGRGVSRLTVKKVLNHADVDVTAIYDRHSYDVEKRQALEVWGRFVAGLVGNREQLTATVTPIRSA